MNKSKFCVLLFILAFSGRALANPNIQALSPAQIFEYNADAVFTIYASLNGRSFNSVGSGFFICSTGIAVTNHHVIAGWPYAFIRTHSGQRFFIGGYYSYDLSNDLAIIQVVGRDFPYLTKGNPDSLRIGDTVYAIGSPLGHHNTFSAGMVSRFVEVSVFGIYRVYGMIQITVPISPGSSGGALFNVSGQVVGITTAQNVGARVQALNFAVPIARVDLTGIESEQYLRLPIGGASLGQVQQRLQGSWIWDGGDVVLTFSGARFHSSSYWGEGTFTVSGSRLTLNRVGGSVRHYDVFFRDDNILLIGNWTYHRQEGAGFAIEMLQGSWVWDGGDVVLTFSGTRFHSGSHYWGEGTFTVSGSRLTLNRVDGGVQHYDVSFRGDNTLLIGNWTYHRQEGTSFAIEMLQGSWVWDRSEVVLTFSGTRFHSSSYWGEGTFIMSGSRLTLILVDGSVRHYDVSFRDDNTLLIGNWTYHRQQGASFAIEMLQGSWVWDGGEVVLTFSGSRFYSDSYYWGEGTFTVSGSRLTLNQVGGSVQHYDVSFRDDNTLLIGNWTYHRRR